MSQKKEPDKKPRGKPLGTRSIEKLHDKILEKLVEDKESGGDGMTPFAISKALAIPDPTIRLYLGDMVEEGKVTSKKIVNMVLYRPKRKVKKEGDPRGKGF